MRLEIWDERYSLQWDGTYHLALFDYPKLHNWELEKIATFLAYEKLHGRETEIVSKDKAVCDQLATLPSLSVDDFPFTPSSKIVASTYDAQGHCVYSDFLSHTCTAQTAQEIFKSDYLLSAVQAFKKTPQELVQDSRNAAGDPEDYFDYVMLAWSNTTSGYRLAMERLLGRMPTDDELGKDFIPGVSFHFRYDDMITADGYVFDGYHPAKIKDSLDLENLFACIIPANEKINFEKIIPKKFLSKVYYLDYQQEGLMRWSDKVYDFVKHLS
ncbi:phosphate ABC transporter ATPase [Streptococcus dentiloxodontae]